MHGAGQPLYLRAAMPTTCVKTPWGSYTDLFRTDTLVVKILTIAPGESTSLQSHDCRDEVWWIISGDGKAEWDGQFGPLHAGYLCQTPQGCIHAIHGGTKLPLEIVEIQSGLCSEDDITRFMDRYHRPTTTQWVCPDCGLSVNPWNYQRLMQETCPGCGCLVRHFNPRTAMIDDKNAQVTSDAQTIPVRLAGPQRHLVQRRPFRLWRNRFVHNVFAHPLYEILHTCGLHNTANWVHEVTAPTEVD